MHKAEKTILTKYTSLPLARKNWYVGVRGSKFIVWQQQWQKCKQQSKTVSDVLQYEYTAESVQGVAVCCVSLVGSLSNEALWSHGSCLWLGPHTSLMFSHHSPDNYWGRECHLRCISSTEDDSTRSVVGKRRVSVLHLESIPHTHKHAVITQSEHMCPRNTWCVWLLQLSSSRIFLTDSEKRSICQKRSLRSHLWFNTCLEHNVYYIEYSQFISVFVTQIPAH